MNETGVYILLAMVGIVMLGFLWKRPKWLSGDGSRQVISEDNARVSPRTIDGDIGSWERGNKNG